MESRKVSSKRTLHSTLICLVCGDVARGLNFDVITCMSCKAFFRRNASQGSVSSPLVAKRRPPHPRLLPARRPEGAALSAKRRLHNHTIHTRRLFSMPPEEMLRAWYEPDTHSLCFSFVSTRDHCSTATGLGSGCSRAKLRPLATRRFCSSSPRH